MGSTLILSSGNEKVEDSDICLDVIDLRGKDLKIRLLALSLQGVVNKDKPRVYVIWESKNLDPPASKRWLEYYKEKQWIKDYKLITLQEALRKYKEYVKGIVMYDPDFLPSIDVAVSLAGVYDLIIVHPNISSLLREYGYEVKYDLRELNRNYWHNDRKEMYKWLLEKVMPLASKDALFLYPVDTEFIALVRSCLIDYAVANKIVAVDFKVAKTVNGRLVINREDLKLFHEFLSKLNPFAKLIGYPFPAELEVPTIRFISMHNVVGVLGSFEAPNYSVHSKIGKGNIRLSQEAKSIILNKSKIYIALFISDLGLNSIHNFYYGLWLNENRGKIPLNWWLDSITLEFAPGILQYYIETSTPNDYFYSANVYGRITPSDFKDLRTYLEKGDELLKQLGLEVVAFSDSKFNESAIREYSKLLTHVKGLAYGYLPSSIYPNYWMENEKPIIALYKSLIVTNRDELYSSIKDFINERSERPLFIIIYVMISSYNITINDLLMVEERLRKDYGDEIEFIKANEILELVKEMEEEISRINIPPIKVAIMYQNLHSPPHYLEGAMRILDELQPDIIWYSRMITGFPPVPNESSAYYIAKKAGLSDEKAEIFAKWVRENKYTLEAIREEVESTNALYCPCILVQNLRVDFNYDPLTFEPIPREKLESMALDFSKWGLPYNRSATQRFVKKLAGIPEGACFPDVTNKDYQEYLFRKVMALKKIGVKCVRLDMLFTQASIAYALTKDYNHPAVKEAYYAACSFVKRLKKEGLIVGTWAHWVIFPYNMSCPVDFVTKTVGKGEVLRVKINEDLWKKIVKTIRGKTNATIFMVFDFGPFDDAPLALFSQKLSEEQQEKFLEEMYNVCKKLGCVPVFPVHGGSMGRHPEKLAYGRYRFYDALAPEFDTYDKIRELILKEIRSEIDP